LVSQQIYFPDSFIQGSCSCLGGSS